MKNLKLLCIVLVITMLATFCFYGCKKGGNNANNNGGNSSSSSFNVATKLATPTDLVYTESTNTLSWAVVENALDYIVCYNGTNYNLSQLTSSSAIQPVSSVVNNSAPATSAVIYLTETLNTFKVKAIGDGINYTDSNWSQEYIFTKLSLYQKVNNALKTCAESERYTLERVVGIRRYDQKYLTFETICKNNYKSKIINATIKIYNSIGGDIAYLFSNLDKSETDVDRTYDIVDYDTATNLLISKQFDGEMQKLYNQGYTISVIDSIVRKGQKYGNEFCFELVGTYKATLGTEVEYFTSVNRIDIQNPSSVESANYQEFVRIKSHRTITETSFVLHEAGGTLQYMQDLISEKEQTA